MKRVTLEQARKDIGIALACVHYHAGDLSEADQKTAAEAQTRVNAFLAQVEAREALLMESLRACQAISEAKNNNEAFRARSLARSVISQYGEPGGMHAN